MTNRTVQLPPIDIAAVPMFLHAFRLAATTAMMCGYPNAKELFNEYAKLLEGIAPPVYKMFRSEESLYEISVKLATCKRWSVYIKEYRPSSWRYEGWEPYGWIVLQMDDHIIQHESWVSTPSYKPSSPEFIQLVEFIAQIAPLEAERWEQTYEVKDV